MEKKAYFVLKVQPISSFTLTKFFQPIYIVPNIFIYFLINSFRHQPYLSKILHAQSTCYFMIRQNRNILIFSLQTVTLGIEISSDEINIAEVLKGKY